MSATERQPELHVVEMSGSAFISRPDGNEAFRALFVQEEGALVQFAYGIVRRREVAEELVQDGFIQLFGQGDAIENPRAWIYRAVRNLALNYLRKHKRESLRRQADDGVVSDTVDAPDEKMVRMERVGMLRMCVAGCSADDRQMLRMKFEEGKSYREIAEEMKLTVSHVGYKLHHLLKRLGGEMGGEDGSWK